MKNRYVVCNDEILVIGESTDAFLSYFIAGILPFAFFLFFVGFFLPIMPSRPYSDRIDFKDYNSIDLLRNRVIGLMSALVFSAVLYTKVFKYYPLIIVFSDTTALIFDPLVYYTLMFLICFFFLLCQLIYRYKTNLKKEELIYLSFFMFASLAILFQANLIGIFLCLELFSLSSYLLVAGLGRKVSIEAAIKYSLIGLLGTVFFLAGITFVILNFGILNLFDIGMFMRYEFLYFSPDLKYYALCGSLFLISLFLKLGVVPFHFWILDVYKGVSPVTFIWLITVSKVILVFVLINLLQHLLYFVSMYYENIFLGLSVASIIVGSIGGLRQRNLKGLFAYSSIVTVGFVLLPFVFYFENPRLATTLSLSYLVVYLFNLISFFFFLSKYKDQYIIFNNLERINNITKANPLLAFGLVFSLFAFMGLPPLLGFFPKVFILSSLIELEYYYTVAICVICTLFTGFYYFLILKRLCFSKTNTYLNYTPFKFFDYIIILIIIIINLGFIFFFNDLLIFIDMLF